MSVHLCPQCAGHMTQVGKHDDWIFSCSSHGYWQINNRGAIVPIKLPRSNNEAIAAHTFSDEELAACAALAKREMLLRGLPYGSVDYAPVAARKAVDAIPLDTLKRLAGEGE